MSVASAKAFDSPFLGHDVRQERPALGKTKAAAMRSEGSG